jgi:hypothetical protein
LAAFAANKSIRLIDFLNSTVKVTVNKRLIRNQISKDQHSPNPYAVKIVKSINQTDAQDSGKEDGSTNVEIPH